MIEYTVLTTFACILAFFTLWTLRTAKKVGRKLYNAFLPSSKSNLKKPITDEELPTLSGELQFLTMPWGWSDSPYRQHEVLVKPEAIKPAAHPTPWGWPGGNPGEIRHHHPGLLHQFSERVQQQASMVEIPFARNRNVASVKTTPMLTYFSDDGGILRFPTSTPEKDRGFQLPWGW